MDPIFESYQQTFNEVYRKDKSFPLSRHDQSSLAKTLSDMVKKFDLDDLESFGIFLGNSIKIAMNSKLPYAERADINAFKKAIMDRI